MRISAPSDPRWQTLCAAYKIKFNKWRKNTETLLNIVDFDTFVVRRTSGQDLMCSLKKYEFWTNWYNWKNSKW
jgi:hypothetical protein